MCLVSLHPVQDSYMMIHVPDMQKEVAALMAKKDLYIKT